MPFDLGGSSSTSKQATSNRQQTVSDQAVAFQDYSRQSTRLAKGATLTINNGLSKDDVQGLLDKASVNPNSADDQSFKEAVLVSLNQRAAASTDRAVDETKAAAPSAVRNWIVYAIGAVFVFGLVILFGRKAS